MSSASWDFLQPCLLQCRYCTTAATTTIIIITTTAFATFLNGASSTPLNSKHPCFGPQNERNPKAPADDPETGWASTASPVRPRPY